MMKLQEKYHQLIQKIHEKTLQGDLQWTETEKRDVFQTMLSGYGIRIYNRPEIHGLKSAFPTTLEYEPGYFIKLFDNNGNNIDEISIDKLDFPYEKSLELFSEIHRSARTSAYNTEQALDNILASLES